MKICLMAAMEQELKPLLKLKDKRVVMQVSGIGKVNAAAKTQAIIDKFSPKMILMIGVAGAADPKLAIGDLIIAKDLIQWDVDATAFGQRKGQILFTDWCFFQANKKIIFKLKKAFAKSSFKKIKSHKPFLWLGRIASGDTFVASRKKTTKLYKEFACQALDMESGSVAQVCAINKVPFAVIKAISDKADHVAKIDFNNFLKIASFNNYQLIKNFLDEI